MCGFFHQRTSLTHSLTHSIGSFCRAGLLCLLFTAILSFTHCSSDDNGGGGGGGDPAVYTCANGTPTEGSPDSGSDVESCASCNAGYTLSDERCNCTPSPKELWTAQLTVGEFTLGGTTAWGFIAGVGSLSETEFTHKGIDYEITNLARTLESGGRSSLQVLFAPFPGNDLVSSWTLDLGSSGSFALNDASPESLGGSIAYIWTDPGFDWADTETHTVKIIGNTCDD